MKNPDPISAAWSPRPHAMLSGVRGFLPWDCPLRLQRPLSLSAGVSAHQPSGGGGTRAKGGARGCGGRAVPATQQSELRLAWSLEAGGRRTTPPLQFEGELNQPQGYSEGSWGRDRRQLCPAGSVVTWERFAGTGVSEGSAERSKGGAAGRRSHWPCGQTGWRRGPETLHRV